MLLWLIVVASSALFIWRLSTARSSGSSREAWRAAWREAMAKRDWATLERMTDRWLTVARSSEERARVCTYRAHFIAEQGRHGEAADALDPTLAATLPARDLGRWLNNRAYYLIQAGRLDDALDELERADVILAGDDDRRSRFLHTCVVGNRGLAALRKGQLDEAERLIDEAHKTTIALAESTPEAERNPKDLNEWHAERWVWLAEIAEKRGDVALQKRRLGEAASLDGTSFGEIAKKKLADLSSAQPA